MYLQDTLEFIKTFKTEGSLKRGAASAQDVSLQERVLAQVHCSSLVMLFTLVPDASLVTFRCDLCSVFAPQLRAALYDVHDIFFLMPQNERLGLLQQDRELRRERKLREMVRTSYSKGRRGLCSLYGVREHNGDIILMAYIVISGEVQKPTREGHLVCSNPEIPGQKEANEVSHQHHCIAVTRQSGSAVIL